MARHVQETGFLFRYTSDAEFKPGVAQNSRPTESLTVYRGAGADTGRGMSWSLDCDRARWFAARRAYLQPAALYRATVPPRAVLGLFNDRVEHEVVVNPHMLRGRIELVEHVPPPEPINHSVFGVVDLSPVSNPFAG